VKGWGAWLHAGMMWVESMITGEGFGARLQMGMMGGDKITGEGAGGN